MRYAGRISEWNDDKGFGFVVPNGGGDRAFVHIKEFQRGSRRPVDGDLISYVPVADERGRLQARQVRHAGAASAPKARPSRIPRAAIGVMALLAIGGCAVAGVIPGWLGWTYGTASAVSWGAYLFDKQAAEHGRWRTQESTLHLFDLLGGWPGALVAQQQFRHKTVKQPFQFVFWMTVAANLAGAWWLLSSGDLAALAGG